MRAPRRKLAPAAALTWSLSFGLTTLSILAPREAHAEDVPAEQPPATAEPLASRQDVALSLNGKAAYLAPPIRGGTTPFDTGLGGALGLTISGVYVGASVLYFLGGKDVTISDHSLFYGLELGYDLKLTRLGAGHLVLRPQVGGGGVTIYHTDPSTSKVDVVSTASGSSSSRSSDTTSVNAFYVAPQVTLMYQDEHFLLGAASTLMLLPSVSYSGAPATTWLSYGGEALAGVRF